MSSNALPRLDRRGPKRDLRDQRLALVVGTAAGVLAARPVARVLAAAVRERGRDLLDLHDGLQFPARPRRLHLVRPAGLSRRGRLCGRRSTSTISAPMPMSAPVGDPGGDRRVADRRPAVRPPAQRLFRAGQSRACGDHLLPHAEGPGRHHARRQRAVVPHQHRAPRRCSISTRPDEFFIFTCSSRFAVWAFYKYLDDSLFGACCLATKLNEDKLQFLGYSNFASACSPSSSPTPRARLPARMYAVYLGFVSPEITSPARAADPVVVTILGGVGTLYGPLVGSFAYTGMKDVISKFDRQLGALHRLPARVHHARGRKGHLGHARAAARQGLYARRRTATPRRATTGRHAVMMDPQLLISGRHLRPQHRQHLLPDGDRAVACASG